MYQFLAKTVAGHMTRTVKTVGRGLTLRELGEMFERDDFNAYPVEDDGQMVGLVTKFDLLKCFAFTPNQMVPRYDELMQRTDPTLVGLCLDTGHLMLGGGDPLEIYRRHAARVWHVHFKDFDPGVFQRARGGSWNYFEAMRHGIFCELGRGAVDFAAMLRDLREHGYDDWIVVEQDVLPGMGSPAESARRNRDFLRGLGV